MLRQETILYALVKKSTILRSVITLNYSMTKQKTIHHKVTAYLEHYHLKALNDEDFVYWAHYYGDVDITTGWWYFLILPSRPNEGIEYWYNEDPISWGTVRIDALTGVYEIIETEDCFEWQ